MLLPLAGYDRCDAHILHRLPRPLNMTDDGIEIGRDDGSEYRLRILRIVRALEHIDDHLTKRVHVWDWLRPMFAGGFLVSCGKVLAGNSSKT